MKILVLHNRYRQPGGEDALFQAETELLRSQGHEVHAEVCDNEAGTGIRGLVALTAGAAWSPSSYRRVRRICRNFRPDVAHIHNFWMRLSPSVHSACHAEGVPVVQTLHNYRLICAGAALLREGKVCEDCVGKLPWRGIVHRCYRGSFSASAAVTGMIAVTRVLRTWRPDIDAFITLSRQAREIFIRGGLSPDQIFVKPNFTRDPGESPTRPSQSRMCLFAGRLSEEKGVRYLLDAWALVRKKIAANLVIAGDGPERPRLAAHAQHLGFRSDEVRFLGYQRPAEIGRLLEQCRMLVMPSIWREPFGLSLIEAFARSRPAVAFAIGAPAELIPEGHAGFVCPPGDVDGLAQHIYRILSDDDLADRMGASARLHYLRHFTPETNYDILLSIYRHAIDRRVNQVSKNALALMAGPEKQ